MVKPKIQNETSLSMSISSRHLTRLECSSALSSPTAGNKNKPKQRQDKGSEKRIKGRLDDRDDDDSTSKRPKQAKQDPFHATTKRLTTRQMIVMSCKRKEANSMRYMCMAQSPHECAKKRLEWEAVGTWRTQCRRQKQKETTNEVLQSRL